MFILAWSAGGGFYVALRPIEPPTVFELPVWAFGAALLATAVLWPLTTWSREPSTSARAVSVAFATCTLLVVLDSIGGFVLLVLATANLVFVLGPWAAAFCVLAVGAEQAWANAAFGNGFWVTTAIVAFFVQFYGTAVVAAEFVRRGLDDKRRVESLLEELEQAYARLRASAARIRELTLIDERARLSREMHDSVGQHLTAASMALRLAHRSCARCRKR